MMTYYQKIQIRNEAAIAEHYSYTANDAGILLAMKLEEDHYPWIEQQLGDDLNMVTGKTHKIRSAVIFIQVGNHRRGIHVDGVKDFWALNIPLINCQSAEMSWYDGKYTKKLHHNPGGLPHFRLTWEETPRRIESVMLDSPMIVKVDTPHGVENFSSEPRSILSIRFTPELF
jgi:hypothetical protein